jgi:phosphatidylserine decarboxylase
MDVSALKVTGDLVREKHRGRSWVDGMKVVALVGIFFALIASLVAVVVPSWTKAIIVLAGLAFLGCAACVLVFFRDADPHPPDEAGVLLSPSHGTIDYIDTTTETHFLNGPVRRISIYLSLKNVHVQNAPASGSVDLLQHFPGRWSRAVRRDASLRNEHLLVGLTLDEGHKIALRLISGIVVRRIVPWIAPGQQVIGGERIGLIRFGSRVDVFVPLDWQVTVKPGDKVCGGETFSRDFRPELPRDRLTQNLQIPDRAMTTRRVVRVRFIHESKDSYENNRHQLSTKSHRGRTALSVGFTFQVGADGSRRSRAHNCGRTRERSDWRVRKDR